MYLFIWIIQLCFHNDKVNTNLFSIILGQTLQYQEEKPDLQHQGQQEFIWED